MIVFKLGSLQPYKYIVGWFYECQPFVGYFMLKSV